MEVLGFVESLSDDKIKITYTDGTILFSTDNICAKLGLIIEETNMLLLNNDSNSESRIVYHNIKGKGFSNVNSIFDLVEACKHIVSDIYNYCVGCYTRLEFQSDQFITCGKPECDYILEELEIGSPVVEKIKDDSDITRFILESAFDAITCNRKYDIFEPFPKHFLTKDGVDAGVKRGEVSKLIGKNFDQYKDFAKLESIVKSTSVDKIFDAVDTCLDDAELRKVIGDDTYKLVRFIITSCKSDLSVDSQLFDPFANPETKSCLVYRVNHPIDKEKEFKKRSNGHVSYLFHGSAWCNWYSIMRNGLKNCSSTKLMTAGAAHGNGIYLANSFQYSSGYGRYNNRTVVGVFEVIGAALKYKKSGCIHVVTDEKDLIQRYLLIIPSIKVRSLVKLIDSKFSTTIHTEKTNIKRTVLSKGIRKLVREHKKLSKVGKDLGFRIDVKPKNMYLWTIYLFDFGKDEQITKDMKKYNIDEIRIEVSFPDNYPFSPPFLRVVTPRFVRLTGHVTSAGALCMQLLTEKHWDPACSMESLIITIRSEILEGGGRIDPNMHNIPYPETDARRSFINVSRGHGWI